MSSAKQWRFHVTCLNSPKGQKRPADVIGNSVKVMTIATGEEEGEFDVKDPAAKVMARRAVMRERKS